MTTNDDGRCARPSASPALSSHFLTPFIIPYCMSPTSKARCMRSRHTISLRVLYQIRGLEKTGNGSHTPAHTECRQLAIVCLVQSSVSTARIAPVFFNNHAYLSMLMKYGCAHSLYR